ncbi:hypothetical protein DUI87_02635 [Hirundo rustica rustica]|uniref:Uncharacterized protein n=1 Tax=Hirundo rustica rustica TaxID=333673 RepID=A0A3M0L9S1_HIRRU|nr:hypothetical protein DUI87_02635 [Hirundo rustica rustica]
MRRLPPLFSAVPEEIPVDQERGTRDPCCRPPSPDNVPLPDKLEDDGAVLSPAETPAEPTIGLKELTDQIQAVMQCLDDSMIALAAMIYKKFAVQLFERHLCFCILTFGFMSAKITNKLVVAHITKSEMYLYDTAFTGPALLFHDQVL